MINANFFLVKELSKTIFRIGKRYLLVFLLLFCFLAALKGIGCFKVSPVNISFEEKLVEEDSTEKVSSFNILDQGYLDEIKNNRKEFFPDDRQVDFTERRAAVFSENKTKFWQGERENRYFEGYEVFDDQTYNFFSTSDDVFFDNDEKIPDERHFTFLAYFRDDDIAKVAKTNIHFQKANLDKCGVFSFLNESQTIFLACLEGYDEWSKKADFFLLGFYADGEEADLKPFYYDSFFFNHESIRKTEYQFLPEKTDQEILITPFRMIQVDKDKYYLVFENSIDVLAMKEDVLENTKTVFFTFNDPDFHNESPQVFTQVKGSGFSLLPGTEMLGDSSFMIYRAGVYGGGLIDTATDQALEIDKSCFLPIYKEDYPLAYNAFIDPIVIGPYKSVDLLNWDSNKNSALFEQTYCSGGGCVQEGLIEMKIGEETASCIITPIFKDITSRYE